MAEPKRTLRTIYDSPSDGLRGAPGHRDYTETDLRLIREWQRVTALTGAGNDTGIALRRRAARLLAAAPLGYVWISGGKVGWSLNPPIYTMKQGAACWPVTSGLD